jgi:hypothetical protein
MDKRDLVIVTAKDLFLKAMDQGFSELNLREKENGLFLLAEKFKTFSKQISSIIESTLN